MMDEKKRIIYAEDLATEIESLDITVSGKSASWDVAKATVLRLIEDQPTVECRFNNAGRCTYGDGAPECAKEKKEGN